MRVRKTIAMAVLISAGVAGQYPARVISPAVVGAGAAGAASVNAAHAVLMPTACLAAVPTPSPEDARAAAVARDVARRLGGRAAWNAVRCLGWTIFGRTHRWDRRTGDYRLEEDSTVTVLNLRTGTGRVWVAGRELTSTEKRDAVLARAKSVWINDSYWLLMPYKLLDDGVILRFAGTGRTKDGRQADVLDLTFRGVGETPGNRYEVYVDHDTRLVSQWAFYETAQDSVPRFVLPWDGWKKYGDLWLSSGRGRFKVTGIFASTGDCPARTFSGP